jgi:DNA-binding transcriptional regulator YhcF (GntR family)/DNA-binding LacI/PurR family transcriptional regulator
MKLERYRQIAMELSVEIESGVYSEGDIFPTRTELAERFKVTRTTINRAVNILIEKGLITARRGAGSVVISTTQRYNIAYVAPKWLMRHIPTASNCSLKYISYEDSLGTKTKISKLTRFDGILWSHPDEKYIPQIIHYQQKLPGVIINRDVPECNFVTTDHYNCFAKHVEERLAELPSATPFFLHTPDDSRLVNTKRKEGFISSCRKLKRFYEIIQMPTVFADKIATLTEKIEVAKTSPVLIFSDNWNSTGALVQWALLHKLRWGKDIYYTDVDNTQIVDVWGITTTSIIQDFYKLSQEALVQLQLIIKNPSLRRQLYIDPEIRLGDT